MAMSRVSQVGRAPREDMLKPLMRKRAHAIMNEAEWRDNGVRNAR